MVKISIAIPTYNRSSFLKETLASILPQMRPGVELVISDNGSTDNTLESLKSYPQIRVVGFENNEGIDHNIVNVIKHSLGKYVFLFSDDDLLLPGSLDKILEEIEKTSPVMLCLNHFAFKNHSLEDRQPPFLPIKRKRFYSGASFFKCCGLGFLSSLVFKKEAALEYVSYVRFGRECAHLEIVSRIALHEKGVYVLMGNVCVAGRALEKPRYNLIDSCVIYPKKVYDELLQEGLLNKKLYLIFIRRLIYKDVMRILYKLMKNPVYEFAVTKKVLEEEFKEFVCFTTLLSFLDKMNKKVLYFFFSKAFYLVKLYRKIRLKRGLI